jgi:hypothetical protein
MTISIKPSANGTKNNIMDQLHTGFHQEYVFLTIMIKDLHIKVEVPQFGSCKFENIDVELEKIRLTSTVGEY